MTHPPRSKTLGSAIKVVAFEIVTLLLLFVLQQAFTR
ncbi:hypothetical protein LuPra_00467 [Luteitalea pratensis]|jgi:hypothetical protein|uniref:Uncharacterized protein n=1 Tax=Luteitalea pratensis TaxID=1855912 RepID=A0A143PGA8_LUTPR|nr:hypothetical protein LuPra_00467 [Luteitalea pratensis]